MADVTVRLSNLDIKMLRPRTGESDSSAALLLEQFARWAYNAHSRRLGKDFLNRPLPPGVNRDQGGRPNLSGVNSALRSAPEVES